MYLDLDVHFSDGVSEAFHHSALTAPAPQILTLSLHHASPGFFPASALSALRDPAAQGFDPFTLAVPLERGAADAAVRRAWAGVERVRAAFRPEYVVVQCGVDGLAGDPHGVWNWSLADGEGSLGWCVERVCATWGCKVLLLGGGELDCDESAMLGPAEMGLGGYNHPNAARAWTYLTSIAVSAQYSLLCFPVNIAQLGRALPPDSDIPDHAAFPLYAPSFTLGVPAGNAPDRNTDAYLGEIETHLEVVARMIEERVDGRI